MARIAKSLDTLRAQVNTVYPDRSKANDGWIGDAAHASRKSDHNPNSAGVVQALDITHDPKHGFNSYEFAEHLRTVKDNRIKYVISNHKIFMGHGSNAWKWQNYTGSNPHSQHVHISVSDTSKLYDDPSQWDIGEVQTPPFPEPRPDPTLEQGDDGADVARMQGLLNQSGAALDVDGQFGDNTEAAVRTFQLSRGLEDDGICGPATWADLKIPTQPGMNYNITATVFGGRSDPNNSAYDGHTITDTELSYALPARDQAGRAVHVYNRKTNKSANGYLWDVGPWCTTDRYWVAGARPMAEISYNTKRPLPAGSGPNAGKVANNPAGIDLTPALAKAIGIDGKGVVDWTFAEPITPPEPEPEPIPEFAVVTITTQGPVKLIINGAEVVVPEPKETQP
jgi:peptidoglycan hydrolase-like protein with peptidoglycan-binding domain